MDAIELLKRDHRKVEDLFMRFRDGGGVTGAMKRLTGNAASPRQHRSVAERHFDGRGQPSARQPRARDGPRPTPGRAAR